MESLLGRKDDYDEWDLCRPLLPVAYSPSGHHSSGWKSGFLKCAVLKWELTVVNSQTFEFNVLVLTCGKWKSGTVAPALQSRNQVLVRTLMA